MVSIHTKVEDLKDRSSDNTINAYEGAIELIRSLDAANLSFVLVFQADTDSGRTGVASSNIGNRAAAVILASVADDLIRNGFE